MKILLVDDKEENLYLLEKLLQGNGYETLSAANGAEALALALKNPPDMIVSDILMPVMDGFTLCREWRKNIILKKIPFVFYTATYTDPKDEEFALSLGADRFILKPQGMNDLLHIVRETLNAYKANKAHPISSQIPEEKIFLKEYNEALVRKLEDKMTQLETSEKELREKNVTLEKDIEELKQIKEALKKSETRFRSYFELPIAGIAITSPTAGWIQVNDHLCEMLGYSREELHQKTWAELTHPDDLDNDLKHFERVQAGEIEGYSLDKRFICKNGKIIWTGLSVRCVRFANRKVNYFVVLLFDISDRKAAEKNIRESEEKYRSIYENSNVGILLTVPDGTILSANDFACNLFGMTEEELCQQSRDTIVDKNDPRLSVALEDRHKTGRTKTELTFIRKDGTKFEGEISTVVFVDTEGKEKTSMIIQDLTELNKIKQELQDREKRLSSIFDTVGDIIFMLDVEEEGEYRFASVNQMFLKTTGLSLEAIVGKNVRDVITEPSLNMVLGKYKQAIREKTIVRWEETTDYPTGKLTGEVSITPLFDEDGNCIHLVGAVHDITERKQAEEVLRHKTALLEAQLNSSIDGILVVDRQGKKILQNQRTIELWKIPQHIADNDDDQSQIQHVMHMTVNPDLFVEKITHLYNHPNEISRDEVELTDGRVLYRYSAPVLSKDGQNYGRIWTFSDITERKRAEEELRKNDIMIRTAVENLPLIFYVIDPDGKFRLSIGAGLKGLGLEPNQVVGQSAFDVYKDFPDITDSIKKSLTGESVNFESHIMGSSFANYTSPISIINGKIAGIVGVALDITERKRAEEELSAITLRQQAILAAVPDIIMEVDNNKIYIWANKAGMDFFGDDVIGKEASYYFEGDQEIYNAVQPLFNGNEEIIYIESWQRRKDGEKRLLAWWCRVLKDNSGNVTGALSSARDITERKWAEEALATEQFQMSMLMDNVPDHIYFKDHESRFIRMNKSQAARFGLNNPAEAVGKTDFDFFTEQHAQPAFEDEQKIMKTGQPLIGVEEKETWPDGSMTWVTTTKMPLRDKKGKIIGTFGISKDITQRKKMEEALRESVQLFQGLFEASPDAIVLIEPHNPTGSWPIMDCNETACHMNGYTREELVGHSIDILNTTVGTPEERTTYLENIRKNGIIHLETSHRHKDGHIFPIETSTSIVTLGGREMVLGIDRDITERRLAEEDLHHVAEGAHAILWRARVIKLENEIDGCAGYMWDTHYLNLDTVNKFMPLQNHPSNNLSQRFHFSVLEEDRNAMEERSSDALNHGRNGYTQEFKLRDANGVIHWMYEDARIKRINDTQFEVIGFITNITEQKKLQQELLQSQKMESIGTLAGGIAHDFNNILGIILGYTSFMERETISTEKLHESLGVINNAVKRGAMLVGQILTFARKTEVVFKPVSVGDLIHELLSMLRQTFPKVITFIDVVDKNIPFINADRTQLHQVMLNLCVNARDAMPNGGTITIKAEKQMKEQVQKRVPAADRDSYICISVTDTGEGMNEAIRRQIFDPFFTTKEQGKGTGLGLAVVYGAVQSHHGFIEVESEVGRGTTFLLYFPIPLASEQSSDVSLLTESFTTGGTETILLVEDEEALLEIVRLLLESNGYKVLTAQDGSEAIKMYTEYKQEIDVVLTDMGLPGMTGKEVFKKLKDIDPHVKVITASGFFEPDVKSKLEKAGAKGFIQKPYTPDEVLRILRQVLDEKKK